MSGSSRLAGVCAMSPAATIGISGFAIADPDLSTEATRWRP